ncbi:MAG: uracil-DNA glycosylase family protein [Bacteroidetes bacterium]|nr:uracil-DNA glycosylase family protein [Bacteroidota bacterium]
MEKFLQQIRACTVCAEYLEYGANPVIMASSKSRIVIIGQAPGRLVHASGIPWDDQSGGNLRGWLNIDKQTFYDPGIIALMPMGFCYPGKDKTGDLPPRRECAPLWHQKLLSQMNQVSLILLVGQYAQNYYLGSNAKSNLTETVRHFSEYLPKYFPLPHPSPRNYIWKSKNPWFDSTVLPELKKLIHGII